MNYLLLDAAPVDYYEPPVDNLPIIFGSVICLGAVCLVIAVAIVIIVICIVKANKKKKAAQNFDSETKELQSDDNSQ